MKSSFDSDPYDTERYEELGYTDGWRFYMGQSKYNKSIFGWNGHTKDGETIGTTEG